MNTQVDKRQENKEQSGVNQDFKKKTSNKSSSHIDNNSPKSMVDNSPEAEQAAQLQAMADNSPEALKETQLQLMADEHGVEQEQPNQKKNNNTGLPDMLKTGMEDLSGMPLDDVKVHRNSDKPAQLQAHAYAEGNDIHLASGQEEYLPHEAWHVVQQKEGRVNTTMQMKGNVNVNDDSGLEKEADVMGTKALQMKSKENESRAISEPVIQKKSTTQRAEDLNLVEAKLINEIREDATEKLWTNNATNSEVQVGIEGTVATVGFNVGGVGANAEPNVSGRVERVLAALVKDKNGYNENEGSAPRITEIKLIRSKVSTTNTIDNRAIHAEGIIISERLGAMLTNIQAGEEVVPAKLNVMGKKAACKQCGSMISRLQEEKGINQFLEIRTASDLTYKGATGTDAKHGSNSVKWRNPIARLLDDAITADEYVRAHSSEMIGHEKKGKNHDNLLHFILKIREEASLADPH
jgi:hypothetical protein